MPLHSIPMCTLGGGPEKQSRLLHDQTRMPLQRVNGTVVVASPILGVPTAGI